MHVGEKNKKQKNKKLPFQLGGLVPSICTHRQFGKGCVADMFAKNLFLKLEQLHNQARQGLVGRWFRLYVLGKEGKEDRDGRPILYHLPFLPREFLEAPGAGMSCLYTEDSSTPEL